QVAAARDRLWAAMARESAHQLGTPLMSLTGWIAYLRDNPDTTAAEVASHLQADAERLERVAKRFERIGRPARREPIGLGAVAERVVSYFRPRLPTLASPVTLSLAATGPGPTALGDSVLVEWALEAVIKNAIDALSGRGGRIDVAVEATARTARVTVRDDGPGVAPDVRAQLFEPGVSTKPGGERRRSGVRAGIPAGEREVSLALNPAQEAAVRYPGGPLLVLAGAGSGKTRVLTARIAYLIQERGVAPARIFAVTFTNKAAGEMRARVATLLGADPRGLWIGTFHALSARLLRREAALLG